MINIIANINFSVHSHVTCIKLELIKAHGTYEKHKAVKHKQ